MGGKEEHAPIPVVAAEDDGREGSTYFSALCLSCASHIERG